MSGTVTVTANASDNVGVAGVQFKLDGANLGAEDTSAPYSVPWNTTGAPTGRTRSRRSPATPPATPTTSAAVTVTVVNDDRRRRVSDRPRPPRRHRRRGTIAVTANASDNVGVVGVQFRLDGANLGAEDTTAPYSVPWNTGDGHQRVAHPDGGRARCGRQHATSRGGHRHRVERHHGARRWR